jgi:hypothetical protein
MAVRLLQEAAMAEITFDAAHEKQQARKRIETAPAAGAGVAVAYLATIKRLFMRGLIILAAGAALAAIMELKLVIYLLRLTHH